MLISSVFIAKSLLTITARVREGLRWLLIAIFGGNRPERFQFSSRLANGEAPLYECIMCEPLDRKIIL